jgi:hypothetical protein
MLATVIGFVIRYLPNLFGWVGDFLGKKEDFKREKEMLLIQMQLEEKKAELAVKGMIVQAEITEALVGLQAEVASIAAVSKDRVSARSFGAQLVTMMDTTLSRGKEMGVHPWLLSLGWCSVLAVEEFSAIIQPSIAAWAFGMWIYTVISGGLKWGAEEYMILEAVIGFYLAGRVQKFEQGRRVANAVK